MDDRSPARGMWVKLSTGPTYRIERVTPKKMLVLEGDTTGRVYRPESAGQWVHRGPVYGRFRMRDSVYVRFATDEEVAAAEKREADKLEEARQAEALAAEDRAFLSTFDWATLRSPHLVSRVAADVRRWVEAGQ